MRALRVIEPNVLQVTEVLAPPRRPGEVRI